jgi:hypothetical protein
MGVVIKGERAGRDEFAVHDAIEVLILLVANIAYRYLLATL